MAKKSKTKNKKIAKKTKIIVKKPAKSKKIVKKTAKIVKKIAKKPVKKVVSKKTKPKKTAKTFSKPISKAALLKIKLKEKAAKEKAKKALLKEKALLKAKIAKEKAAEKKAKLQAKKDKEKEAKLAKKSEIEAQKNVKKPTKSESNIIDLRSKFVNNKNNFKIGEHVIYPSHGIGKIIDIDTSMVLGQDFSCYLMYFEKEKLTIKVPLKNSEKIGLRPLVSKEQMDEVFSILRSGVKKLKGMWSRRAQEYESKINSGDIIALAEVLRDLTRDIEDGERSYSERIIYETAVARLAAEYAVIHNVSFDAAKDEVIATAKDKINSENKNSHDDDFDGFDKKSIKDIDDEDADEEESEEEEDEDEEDDDDGYDDEDEDDDRPKKRGKK